MLRLVEKYSNFTRTRPLPNQSETHDDDAPPVVVLTGASGSLGAHILANLLSNPSVKRVYCLVRAADNKSALERVQKSLHLRGLDTYCEDQRITGLASSLSDSRLGLDEATYAELSRSVTTVIDNAWAVNFNIGVESFERDHIAGIHNLINLCLSSPHPRPASFFFCSSISSTAGPTLSIISEKHYHDPTVAQGMGYARSKWVGERVVEAAATKIPDLTAGVFRLGQLVGDSEHGIWNQTEAITLMIKSAQTIGALPMLEEHPSWLPVDLAAENCVRIALEFVHQPQPQTEGTDKTNKLAIAPVWNIINPNTTISWSQILSFLQKSGLTFDIVDRWEWLRLLETVNTDPISNPTYKLLDFFRRKYGGEGKREEKVWETSLKTSSTTSSNAENRTIPAIDEGLIGKFVAQWRREGFLS